MKQMKPSDKGVTLPLRAMQVYSRGEFKVLPLCSGYLVVDGNGREIDRYGVGEVNGAVEFVDELVIGMELGKVA